MNVHALDGMTTFTAPTEPTRLYARPLNYTITKQGNIPDAAYMSTTPAGIVQTPKQIYEFKRTVFDFRGTPLVSLIENNSEAIAAPP